MSHQLKKNLGVTFTDDGIHFCVWAPFAKSVALTGTASNWEQPALANDGHGYWSITLPDAQVGQSYKYIVETATGEKVEKTDPYARQLTESDHGLCIIPDTEFDWGKTPFHLPPPEQQILYELHVGTFNRPDASTSGTFQTITEKLDYLVGLGVNVIELMPITSFSYATGWGYAPIHLFAVEEAYGGRRGFLEFMKACHDRGVGVILDVVYNHIFDQSDLWQFDGWSENDRGGVYFYNDERGDTPWGGRPDYGRPEVRQFLLDNIAMWFSDYHIDGLRVDSTIYMRNTKGPEGGVDTAISEAWSLLQEVTSLARKINPNVLLVAEDSSGEPKVTASTKDGGMGFDSQWGLAFPHAVRASLGIDHEQSMNDLAGELLHTYNENAYQKVIFSDSHDTAANGNVRLNEAASPGNGTNVVARRRSLAADAVTLTAPGIPMLLQGAEFLQDGKFNDYEMLDWHNTEQFAGIVLAHQHLINLRLNKYNNTLGLMGGSTAIFHRDDTNAVMAYHRYKHGGRGDDTLVIINFGGHKHRHYDIKFPIAGTWQVRFNSSWKGYSPDFYETNQGAVTTNQDGVATIALSDYNVLILSQD